MGRRIPGILWLALLLLSCSAPATVSFVDGDADSPDQTEDGDYDLDPEEETEGVLDGDTEEDGEWQEPVDPCDPNPCTELRRTRCTPGPRQQALCGCDDAYVRRDGRCVASPDNSGQTCASPLPLRDNRPVSGSTQGSESQLQPSCTISWPTGPEHVYSLILDETRYVALTLESVDGLVHVRRVCEDATTEVLCMRKVVSGVVRGGAVLEPGEYAVIVDSFYDGAPYTLRVKTRPDPCARMECPGSAQCVSAADWTDAACRCEQGEFLTDTGCVPDPCEPNPCTTKGRSLCEPQPSGEARCLCAPTHVEDHFGLCVPDPMGNRWLVMVYLNADNNLEDAGYTDLAQMIAAGYDYRVHLVILFDSHRRDGGATRLIYVGPDGADVLETLPEADMSDGETLADFGVWALSRYPARRTALILWDHGTGWTKRGGTAGGGSGYKGFSTDYSGPGGEISIASGEYGRALARITEARGGPLDLVGFDACYMGMWEVALATAPYADYLVASMDQVPNAGWRYDAVLGPLLDNPDEDARSFGERIVRVFRDDSDANDTLALVDLEGLGPVNAAINDLADALMAHPEYYAQVEERRLLGQKVFLFETYRDLRHIAQLFASDPGLPGPVREAAQALDEAADAAILAAHIHSRKPDAHGLTFYFPSHTGWVHPDYVAAEAPWYGVSRWGDFLLDFAGLPQYR